MRQATRTSRKYRHRPYADPQPEEQGEAGAAPAPISGCIKETKSNSRHPARKHFEAEFLTCPLFGEIPDPFDICYVIENPNPIDFHQSIHFYLHDTPQPFPGEVVPSEVLASLKLSVSFTDGGWFWSVRVPQEAYIPELETNSALRVFNETYNLTGGGLGSFMILCAIAYLKSKGVKEVKLDDASDRTGQVSDNIYRNLDFDRRDTGGAKASQLPSSGDSSLVGNVEQIYEKFVAKGGWFSSQSSRQGKRRGEVFTELLQAYQEHLDDSDDSDYGPDAEDEGGLSGSDRSQSKRRKKRKKKRRKKRREKQRSKAKQRKAKQSKAKQSKAKQSKAKQSKANKR